jgi:hypothetical protein
MCAGFKDSGDGAVLLQGERDRPLRFVAVYPAPDLEMKMNVPEGSVIAPLFTDPLQLDLKEISCLCFFRSRITSILLQPPSDDRSTSIGRMPFSDPPIAGEASI